MATDVLAVDYFVRKTGNDANAGTSAASAWLTVDHAADSVTAGDTIYIGAGTYTESIIPAATCTGTAANPIRFIADTDGSQTGDAGVVVLTTTGNYVIFLDSSGHDYLQFDGFEIIGVTRSAFASTGSSTGIVIENCDIHSAGEAGISFNNQEVTIRNCSVHDNIQRGIFLQSGAYGVIEDTSVYANGQQGILIAATTSLPPTPVVVSRCRVYGNTSIGLWITNSNATITNCLLTDNLTNGIRILGAGSNAVTIQNCTIASNLQHGIDLTSGTNTVTNCIVANNTSAGILGNGGSVRANNLIFGNGSGDTTANSTEFVADPLFLSSTDYRIPSISPAVNTGTDMTGMVDEDLDKRPRPYDGAWDIGCYEEGPVGHWTFDEGTGTTIADTSGLGRDAAFNTGSPVWIPGPRGSALEFDGTNDAITDDAIDPPATGTVALWWRSDGPPASRQRPWGVGADYEMWQDPDGLVSIDVSTDGFLGGFITTAPLYSPGRWYHIAAVYDSADDSYEIYIDGQLHKSGISTWPIVKQPANLLTFGTRTGITDRFSGALDDFRIYNRKLNAAEVAKLYGLVGHWKLDETVGTVAADSSGIGNDATHTGGVIVNAMGPYPGTGDVAAEFDGLDDQSETASPFNPPATGAVAFWMRGAATPLLQQNLLGVNGNWKVRQETDGTLKFDLGASPSVGSEFFSTADALDVDGQWYHVVANFNDATDTYEVYVNGQLQASGVSPVDLVSQSAGILSIGTQTGSSENWKGALFDLRIYDRELTHRQVAELYGLVGWWKLDETSGSIATDSSGTDLHGTYLSTPMLGESSRASALGTSVNFDGIADYIDLPDAQFDFSNGIAITSWMKPAVAPSPEFAMFGMSNGVDTDEIWFGWSLGFGAMGYLSNTADGSTLRSLSDSDEPAVGIWQHCIISIDYLGNATLYRDGEAIASGFTSLPTSLIRSDNFIAKSVQDDEFPGLLDDVRLYHRPISSDEARQLFDAGKARLRIIKWVEAR